MSARRKGRERGGTAPRAPQPPVRNTTAALYRHSAWAFAAFTLVALVAFWPSYFSRLSSQPTWHPHAHGIAMTLWLGLLVSQAWLIRTGRRDVHRLIGASSYVLVPFIAWATLAFVSFRMQGVTRIGSVDLYQLALMINAVVVFVLIYALAMYHRSESPVHARYMLCTIFPLFTPVTDRLIGRHVPAIVPLVPRLEGSPVVPVAGFLLADAILIALWIWDWRSPRRTMAFPVALGILLAYHASVLTFHRLPAWRAFCEWIFV